MKQTIEVEVPDGYKAVYDKDTQRVIIRKVEKPKVELPKSWEEFCENNPIRWGETIIYNNSKEIMALGVGDNRDSSIKNILPNKETAEAFLALMQLIQLRDCYRQGWTPDWKDEKNKFSIEIIDGEITTYWDNRRSRILSFQSMEVRDEFWNNFKDLIEQAKELI